MATSRSRRNLNLTLVMALMTYFAQHSVIGRSFPQCGQTTYYLFQWDKQFVKLMKLVGDRPVSKYPCWCQKPIQAIENHVFLYYTCCMEVGGVVKAAMCAPTPPQRHHIFIISRVGSLYNGTLCFWTQEVCILCSSQSLLNVGNFIQLNRYQLSRRVK